MKSDSLRTMLSSAMGLRITMAGLNYGLFWLLSHWLSTEILGGFSLLMNVFLLVQILPLLGLATPLIRRAATERDNVQREMSNALVIALPVAVLIALAIAAVARWSYPRELEWPFWLMAATLLPGAWTLVAESTLLGMERMVVITRVQCAEVFLRVLGAIVMVKLGYGLTGVFGVMLLLRLVAAGVYWWLPTLPSPRLALVDRATLRRNFGEIPVFVGIALLASLAYRLDVIVLSRVQGLEQVGVYSAASRLYDAALMLPTVVALAMMPTLARLFSSDKARFSELLVVALRGSLAFGMLAAIAVAALSQPLIHLLYRPAVAEAAHVLRWLIFAAVLTTADQVLSTTMLAAKAQAEDMKALARSMVVLVVSLLTLATLWGPIGAAVALLLTQVCRVSLRIQWASHALALPGLWREWLRQLGAGAAGALALWLGLQHGGAWSWLLAWASGWLVWVLAARLSGIVGADWRGQLRMVGQLLTGRSSA